LLPLLLSFPPAFMYKCFLGPLVEQLCPCHLSFPPFYCFNSLSSESWLTFPTRTPPSSLILDRFEINCADIFSFCDKAPFPFLLLVHLGHFLFVRSLWWTAEGNTFLPPSPLGTRSRRDPEANQLSPRVQWLLSPIVISFVDGVVWELMLGPAVSSHISLSFWYP